jgi:hypothetical protein
LSGSRNLPLSRQGSPVTLSRLPARDQIKFLNDEAACYEEALEWIRERIARLESFLKKVEEQTGDLSCPEVMGQDR